MGKENKTIQLHIRIDNDTMNVLKKKSKSCGLTQSSFLRYAIHRMSFGQEQDVGKPEEGSAKDRPLRLPICLLSTKWKPLLAYFGICRPKWERLVETSIRQSGI